MVGKKGLINNAFMKVEFVLSLLKKTHVPFGRSQISFCSYLESAHI